MCLLFSFRNPDHERRVREILGEELAELADDISISSDVLRLHREYERTSTTVLNAYLTPKMRGYFQRLHRDVQASAGAGQLQVMQSTGGLVRPERAARLPILTLLSGPAGGAIAAAELGKLVGAPGLLALDMGGTSTDVTAIVSGEPDTRIDFDIGGYAVSYPTIDIHTIGAGGGSIARVDDFGRLTVGPASAGSDPGPACYGKGGTEPTVTDAQLVLGLYDKTLRLGDEIDLDPDLAWQAVEDGVAKPLGLGIAEAAGGIVRLVDTNIVHALRAVSVERGRDPRRLRAHPLWWGRACSCGCRRPPAWDHTRSRSTHSRMQLSPRHPQHRRPSRSGRGVSCPTARCRDRWPDQAGRSARRRCELRARG